MSNEQLFANKPVVLIHVNTAIKSATVLNIGTDIYSATLGLSHHSANPMWINLSNPIWHLSEINQQIIARYMWDHKSSSMIYHLLNAIMIKDKATTIKTLDSMLEA